MTGQRQDVSSTDPGAVRGHTAPSLDNLRRWPCVLALLCAGAIASAAAQAPAVHLQSEVEVDGQPVALAAALQLSAPEQPGAPVRLRATVDLTPAVDALELALIKHLPRERCPRRRDYGWVGHLRQFSAVAESGRLLLRLQLQGELWACVRWRGHDLSQRLARAQMRVQVPLRVAVDGTGLRLRLERPQVQARGALADAARAYFALRGEGFGELLAQAVQRFNDRQQAHPLPKLGWYQGTLKGAEFGGRLQPVLQLRFELTSTLPAWIDWMRGSPQAIR